MTLIHYGWDCSPYSAKTRTYLRFKGIPFDDRHPNAWTLNRTIKGAVGRAVMPTILDPATGAWMQDTSDIIDALEQRHPEPSIVPPDPALRVAALLLELHADEWLPTVIMHTRWNVPGNAEFAMDEFAREGLPGVPRFIARRVTKPIAKAMSSYRPKLGIHPETVPAIEAFAKELIARLEAHFAAHAFLLGDRPCIGDFALFGPLWAHVWRDPDTRSWLDGAPAVLAWFERMQAPSPPGDWAAEVPQTLDPIFRTLFAEQWAFLRDLVAAIDAWAAENPDAARLPRALGDHDFVIGGVTGRRRLITFSQWMLQRPLDAYAETTGDDRARVDAWLDRVGGRAAMQLTVRHRTVRRDFKEVFERPPGEA